MAREFIVTPRPKGREDTLSNYLNYFARVATTNRWSDEEAARIFPGLLEVDSSALDDLTDDDLKSFKIIKERLTPTEEFYRESKVQELFRLRMTGGEKAVDFASRVRVLVNGCYPKFAASNREQMVRDRFVHGLSEELKTVVLNGRNTKLEEAVETALMAENVRQTLASGGRSGGASGAQQRKSKEGGAEDVKPKEFRCYQCNKVGHKAMMCPKKLAVTAKPSPAVKCISERKLRPMIPCVINGAKVELLVDTGSTTSILPQRMFEPTVRESQAFVTANGKPLEIAGRLKDCNVQIGEWIGRHHFYVGDVSCGVIGMDFLTRTGAVVDTNAVPVRLSFAEEAKGPQTSAVRSPIEREDLARAIDPGSDSDDDTGLAVIASVQEQSGEGFIVGEDLVEEVETDGAPGSDGPNELAADVTREWSHVFEGLGKTDLVVHAIRTGEATPICSPSYRLPRHLIDGARKEIAEMLQTGVIRPSQSEWNSPLVLIKKKNGDTRVAVDFRALNKVTLGDAFPMPRVDEVLDGLAGSTLFSTLDFRKGYYQVGLREEDSCKTAFRFEGQLYEFTVLPFGLSEAPATFNRLIKKLFLNVPNVSTYLDDVIVHSRSVEEHKRDLDNVFQILASAGVTLNKEKCVFFKEQVDFLGYTVVGNQVIPQEAKLRAMSEFPRPKSAKELKRFLGLTGYYRSHVPNYAVVAAPLYPLVNKSKSAFHWDGRHESAFERLKAALSNHVRRTLPDFSLPFVVRTDASMDGIGCLLVQETEKGEQIIECASKKFGKTQQRYPVIEQEAYAIMYALGKWQHYLLGKRFLLETDHKPLVWLQTKRESMGKLGRWAIRLAEFQFDVRHIKGVQNVGPDALSRATVATIAVTDLVAEQEADESLQREVAKQRGKFVRRDDAWVYKSTPEAPTRVCVPTARRKEVWRAVHEDLNHIGQAKTRQLLSDRFYWPGLRNDVKKWTKGCHKCATCKDLQPTPAPLPMVPVDPSNLEVMEKISVDTIGPLTTDKESGAKYIVVAVDYVTRWADAMPVPALGGATMIRWLQDHSAKYGVPRELVLDQGSDMESKEFAEYCNELGVKRRYTTPYHHQSNLVERTNRSILNLLRVVLEGETDRWADKLISVLLAYRVSVHSSSGTSPFLALYGVAPRLPLDLRFPTDLGNQRGIAELHERFKIRRKVRDKQSVQAGKRGEAYNVNRRVKERTLNVGSKVYWKKANVGKLDVQWAGPFEVVQVEDTNVLIKGQGPVSKLVHMNQLKYCESDAPLETLRKRGRPRKD